MYFHFSSSFHLCLFIFILLIKTKNFEEIQDTKDISKLVDYSVRALGKPIKGKLDIKTLIPKIPKHIQVYLAVAFSEKDFSSYSKIFNKTLSTISSSFLISDSLNRHYNVSVSPLFFVLPDSGRFSSSIYEVMCNSFNGKRVVAILVIGESPAAFTVSLTAVTSNIPVLWARGVIPSPPGSLQQQDPLEIRLEPGEIQLLEAVRGVFLATHWHSFTVMAAPSLASRCASILDLPPLNPKVVPITRNPHNIFRKMADVSRSTRGVVLLLCDLTDASMVMKVAKKLSMIDGHFVWIWIDTTTKPASFLTVPVGPHQKYTRYLDKTTKAKTLKGASFYQKDGFIKGVKANFDKKIKNKEEKINKNYKKIIKRELFGKIGSLGNKDKVEKLKFVSSHAKVLKKKIKTSDYEISHTDPDTTKQNNTDYSSEFFVQSNDPRHKKKRDNSDYEEEREANSRKEDEIQMPSSKAWGKITEHFPSLLFNKKEEIQKDVKDTDLPIGLLSIKPEPVKLDRNLVKGSVRLLISSLHLVLQKSADSLSILDTYSSCWIKPSLLNKNFSETLAKELRKSVKDSLSGQFLFQEGDRADRSLLANFQILNLVPEKFNINFENDNNIIEDAVLYWRQVGKVLGKKAHLNTIVWPGGDVVASALSARTRSVFRVVTALAPPFVMEGALDEDGQCLRGVICHRVLNSDKDNLTLVFNEMDTQERKEDEVEELTRRDEKTEKPFKFLDHSYFEYHSTKYKYKSSCCYGLAMDLLENIAQELEFEFHLYIVPDGAYGAKNHVWEQGIPRSKWNGIVGDLISGAAHMSFAALSVSKQRSQVIDFSTPYFFSGVSFLAAPTKKSEVPLMAFLLPFSTELWIAIFTSLNITAMAVACYEWLSPFGLNPWGRQRSRNFSIASALWVMWGLLCGHLVAFKAPKSWPNKFLINVWGGFSVIFVASYTANIAALIAGLFFHNSVSDYHDRSLLTQRVGAPKYSSADYYIHRANQHLWEHMQKYSFKDVETGITLLRNGSLDILVADTPILDYYRATDHGCKLQKIVEAINEDTYAIGMNKGFPLKESISAVISKYSNNGYMDILTEKWYGGLPCFKMIPSVELTDVGQPRPLGVAAVAGVFLLLGLGMVIGILILIIEHLFYRYTLPMLRHQPKGTIWRSRNIMFFSQKLYRFINCVELVSPHHAARELVHTLRQGQITSLFQKSVKRKEHEQRRRRKSKAQFFEMIQEIRRVQQEEKDPKLQQNFPEATESSKLQLRGFLTSPRALKHFRSSKSSVSPQKTLTEPLNPTEFLQQKSSKSPLRLDIRRFSKELFFLPRSPKSSRTKSFASLESRTLSSDLEETLSRNDWKNFKFSESRSVAKDRIQTSNAIGRRLSKDASSWLNNSPPDLNFRRKSYLDVIQTKSLSVSDNAIDETSSDRVNLNTPKNLLNSNESEKEPFSKSIKLTPVISTAATLRLASSGSLEKVKVPKARPRLPSPPKSPMIEFRNFNTTSKINVSDTNTSNLYDTITPADEISKKKSNKNTHSRSKSLDNKHLCFGATVINIGSTDEESSKTEKQIIKYATLEHEKRQKLEEDFQKSVYLYEGLRDIQSVNLSKNNQTNIFEGRNFLEKNLVNRKEDFKKNIPPLTSSKIIIDNKSQITTPSNVENLNTKKSQSLYAEPQKTKKNKKDDQIGTGKKKIEKSSELKYTSKPRDKKKDNNINFKQTRAYSAPESNQNLQSASIMFIPEKTFKTYSEYNYYSEHKKFQKSQSFPERYQEIICSKHCFESFSDKKELFDAHSDPSPHNRQCRRMETSGRSRSMPEHYCLLTCEKIESDNKLHRKSEAPTVTLQTSELQDTSSRNLGILCNRRRNKSIEEIDLPPAPPSPPGRNIYKQDIKKEIIHSKKQNQTYLQPP